MVGPPFAGTPGPIILGGLDSPRSNNPRLCGPLPGWLDPLQTSESRSSTQGTEAVPIKPSLEFEFVGPGNELGYHQATIKPCST